jgi:hypothetical protein
MIERVDRPLQSFGIVVDEKIHPALARHAVAQFVHGLKLPGRIDVQQWERRR